jgi:hypothetical protein
VLSKSTHNSSPHFAPLIIFAERRHSAWGLSLADQASTWSPMAASSTSIAASFRAKTANRWSPMLSRSSRAKSISPSPAKPRFSPAHRCQMPSTATGPIDSWKPFSQSTAQNKKSGSLTERTHHASNKQASPQWSSALATLLRPTLKTNSSQSTNSKKRSMSTAPFA